MHDLQELVDIASTHRVENVQFIEPEYHTEDSSKTGKLFSLLRRHAVVSDDEAQESMGIPGRKAYLMVKSRLRRRILNYLFFIDVERVFGTKQVGYEFLAHRSLFCSRLLLAVGARTNAKHFAETALRQAKKHDLTDVHVQSLQLLRGLYSEEGDNLRVNTIHEELLDVLTTMRNELALEDIYQRVRARYRANSEPRVSILNDLNDELKYSRITYKSKSKRMFLMLQHISRLQYSLSLQHEDAMQVCEETLQALSAYSAVHEKETQNFTLAYIRHAICARSYTNGEAVIIANLGAVKDGSDQWFRLMRFYFLLATNCGNLQDAEHIFVSATQHRLFHRIGTVEREFWNTFAALLVVLSDIPSAMLTLSSPQYYNNTQVHDLLVRRNSQHSRSVEWTPHILILALVHGLTTGNTQLSLRTIEAMRGVLKRTKPSEAQQRTHVFLKVMTLFDEDSLSPEDMYRQQRVLMGQLRTLAPDYRGNTEGLELLDYEYLWAKMVPLARKQLS